MRNCLHQNFDLWIRPASPTRSLSPRGWDAASVEIASSPNHSFTICRARPRLSASRAGSDLRGRAETLSANADFRYECLPTHRHLFLLHPQFQISPIGVWVQHGPTLPPL